MSDRLQEPGAEVVTLLGRDATFEGVLAFRGDVRIEGRVKGDVLAHGTLRIESGGSVEGRVEVDELIVSGVLSGEVVARHRVELRSTARVHATVRTPSLALADGCLLDGRCAAGATPSVTPESLPKDASAA